MISRTAPARAAWLNVVRPSPPSCSRTPPRSPWRWPARRRSPPLYNPARRSPSPTAQTLPLPTWDELEAAEEWRTDTGTHAAEATGTHADTRADTLVDVARTGTHADTPADTPVAEAEVASDESDESLNESSPTAHEDSLTADESSDSAQSSVHITAQASTSAIASASSSAAHTPVPVPVPHVPTPGAFRTYLAAPPAPIDLCPPPAPAPPPIPPNPPLVRAGLPWLDLPIEYNSQIL